MKNSIFYTEDIFFLNFFQILYWKNFYFYFFNIRHLGNFFRLHAVFSNFFNFLWVFYILNNYSFLSYFINSNVVLSFKYFSCEPIKMNNTDNFISLIPLFLYSVVLIRQHLKFIKKKYVNYVNLDSNKLLIYLEFIPGLREKYLNIFQTSSFRFILRTKSLRKNKLRYYKRLTRVLKRNIHR